jgi:hypothetical protein
MTDERRILELRELERWFSPQPQPELDTASRDVLKSTVREALNVGSSCDSRDSQAPDHLRPRLKAAVRCALAERQSRVDDFPLFSLRRSSHWLSSAAALILVVLGFGLLGKDVPRSERPIELPEHVELASIGAELASLELQSFASDFVYFDSGDVDGDLRDDIERAFLPSLYLESTEDDYLEGVSQ